MQIDWWTLLLQAVNFLVLVWLLWRFLYKPVRQVIAKRKELAEQAFSEADKKKAEAEAARQRYEDDRAKLAQERQETLKKAHEALDKERQEALEAAQQEADELLESARQTIDKERESALNEIREQAADLAVELAAEVLRQTRPDAAGDIFLDRLDKQLKDMPDEERERLQEDLAGDGAALQVITAAPLSEDEQGRWRDRLSDSLGGAGEIRFDSDPEILGGAELHFPHAVLKLSWADQLRKAKELLKSDEAAS